MKLQRKNNSPVATALPTGLAVTVLQLDEVTNTLNFQPPYLASCPPPSENLLSSDSSPLREFLISRLPRHKASPSLLQRIQNAIQGDEI